MPVFFSKTHSHLNPASSHPVIPAQAGILTHQFSEPSPLVIPAQAGIHIKITSCYPDLSRRSLWRRRVKIVVLKNCQAPSECVASSYSGIPRTVGPDSTTVASINLSFLHPHSLSFPHAFSGNPYNTASAQRKRTQRALPYMHHRGPLKPEQNMRTAPLVSYDTKGVPFHSRRFCS